MNLKKALYYLPGVGLAAHAVKEYKTRKGKRPWYNIMESRDRKALGMYALETGYLAFAIAWKVYVGNGLVTGEWNPLKSIDNMGENKKERKLERKNELEKTINYEDLLKERIVQ
jgi:hypothetical protein